MTLNTYIYKGDLCVMSMHLFFEFLNAAVGTMAFALLFQVPKQYYVNCGIIGGCRMMMAWARKGANF